MKQSGMTKLVAAVRAKLREEYRVRLLHAFAFCQQWCFDQALIAAHEALGLDPDGLKRFADAMSANQDEFIGIWNADAEDCEYAMVKQDQRLKEICGPYFMPYEKRYPVRVSELRKRWDT